ncbi:DUF6078 family protein [Bacteroidales bacterium OttesenSCG-928-M11]|nr:DUF6078 family protein [Bacteroidales bacterium OttesenSCG-928-M11]
MKKSINYKEVPQNYVHCLNTACKRANDCLRFMVGQAVPDDVTLFTTINPSAINALGGECQYFEPIKLIRYALGITHLYDNMSHAKYVQVKNAIHKYFGHARYYRIYNKLYYITPEQQDFIRDLFRKEGVEEEPVFDEYVERYNFSI